MIRNSPNFPSILPLAAILILILMLLFLVPETTYAQERDTDFRQIEERMRAYYQEGKLEEVIDLYKEKCLEQNKDKEKKEFRKFNREVRADIYRWVYLSYAALDMPAAADRIMKKFLVIRHREGVPESDWESIKERAREKYYVAPRFLVGLKFGTNFTMMDPGERYMVLVPIDTGKVNSYYKNYNFNLADSRGVQYGLVLEYALTKHLSITIQPAFSSMRFCYKNRFELATVILECTHRHLLGYIEVPVLITYRLVTGKLRPYVQVGGYYSWLQSGEKMLHAVSLPENYEEEAIIGIKRQFKRSNTGFWLGAGLGYELGNGMRLQVELNYRHGMNNIVAKSRRFENQEIMFAYYDVFDDMKPRNWELSVKLLLPLTYKAFRR